MTSSKREKDLARQRAERQSARRAAAAAKRKQRNAAIASALAVILVAGVAVSLALATRSSDEDSVASGEPGAAASIEPSAPIKPSADAEPSAEPAVSPTAPGSCVYTTDGETAARPAPLPPAEGVEFTKLFTATVTTNQGPLVLELDSTKAPCTVNSFRSLAAADYFADTPCHRLTASATLKVLQCGDPTGTGTGGPGYAFADENLSGATYPRGTLAMANSGPDTNGSQFFLVYADSQLPPAYTPFGTITSGLDILDRVAAGGVDPAADPAPVIPVQIMNVTVEPKV
ncbi:MAG: peptidylprolyl isomerase [Mycobacteriales bacterium]